MDTASGVSSDSEDDDEKVVHSTPKKKKGTRGAHADETGSEESDDARVPSKGVYRARALPSARWLLQWHRSNPSANDMAVDTHQNPSHFHNVFNDHRMLPTNSNNRA